MCSEKYVLEIFLKNNNLKNSLVTGWNKRFVEMHKKYLNTYGCSQLCELYRIKNVI